MKMGKALGGAAAMLVAGLTTASAMAQTNPITSTPLGNVTVGPYEMGYRFTANQSISVVQLGAYDAGSNGLSGAHVVSLWSYNGAGAEGTLLQSVTIDAGTGATLNNGFRFAAITPVNLTIGQSYVVAASNYGAVDQWGSGPSLSTTSAITFNQNLYSSSSASIYPRNSDQGQGYYAGSFLYSATSAAPEPGSWALMILGFGVVGYTLRRRRVSFPSNRALAA